MLPFTKRSLRSEEASELINTGEIEVLPASDRRPKVSAFPPPASTRPHSSNRPPPSSNRPRVFEPPSSDEEMTTLLPRKGMTFSSRPPAAVTPVPMPMLAVTRTPRAMLEEPPTRQFSRPSLPPPSLGPSGIAGGMRASKRPPVLPAPPPQARGTVKAVPVPDSLKSDPRIDPPATVITARTQIPARPTVSWAAALVAMGVFVGLVTAVIARGDADTLIDAAASFVDPTGAHAAASGVEVSSVQTKAEEPRTVVMSSVDTIVAPPAAVVEAPAPAAVAPGARAGPRARVAWVAPRRAWHPAPAVHKEAPAAPKDERVALAAPKSGPHAEGGGRESRPPTTSRAPPAADALAKAQLEASLRYGPGRIQYVPGVGCSRSVFRSGRSLNEEGPCTLRESPEGS